MRKQIKRIIDPFLQAWFRRYMRKPRPFRYGKIRIMVHPEVFPPFFTLSTRILLAYLKPLPLEGKTLLELGCGSGIVSLFAASKGAQVTASDINQTALNMLQQNAASNQLRPEIIYSDLFAALTERQFDYILINPPYYPKKPLNIAENAWFCGEDFEYFRSLFAQLPTYLTEHNQTLMILSEDCDLQTIQELAIEKGIRFTELWSGRVKAEKNYIYRLQKAGS